MIAQDFVCRNTNSEGPRSFVKQITLYAQFHCNQGSGFGAGLQQLDRSKFEFLAVALTFALRIDLLDFFFCVYLL